MFYTKKPVGLPSATNRYMYHRVSDDCILMVRADNDQQAKALFTSTVGGEEKTVGWSLKRVMGRRPPRLGCSADRSKAWIYELTYGDSDTKVVVFADSIDEAEVLATEWLQEPKQAHLLKHPAEWQIYTMRPAKPMKP